MPILRNCKLCGAEFKTKAFWVKQGYGIYCSAKCQYAGRKNGEMKACAICGKETYKSGKALRGSKSQKFFCSKSCQTKWRNSEFIGEKHANYIHGKGSYRDVLKRSGAPEICRLCKSGDPRTLVTHHVDKNRRNNRLSNLAWLCHNCHFLVHHYPEEMKRFMVPMV